MLGNTHPRTSGVDSAPAHRARMHSNAALLCASLLALEVFGGTGCGPNTGAGGSTAGSSSTSASGEVPASSGDVEGDTTSSGVVGEGTTSSTSASTSTGESALEGPGCGEPPPCGLGVYEGDVRIESAADLAALEGYGAIRGMLEVLHSKDLVCLDGLACLEQVGSSVRIQGNAALRSTQGLSNLAEVGVDHPAGSVLSVFIGENAVLERLEGFALEDLDGPLIVWRNPALLELVGFASLQSLSQLVVLENPRLDSLAALHGLDLARCQVNRNPHLCSGELDAVCGDPQSPSSPLRVFHGEECPEGPPPSAEYDPDAREQCSFFTEDCPEDEKCTPEWNGPGLRCRPVARQARLVGESCSWGQDFEDGLDDCERHAICSRTSVCLSMPFADHEEWVCASEDAVPDFVVTGTAVFCVPNCDPLVGQCPRGMMCVPDDDIFSCLPAAPDATAATEACQFVNECAVGLSCVDPSRNDACDQDADGCCLPFCDVGAPECPPGSECVTWWDGQGPHPLPIVQHVGICVTD